MDMKNTCGPFVCDMFVAMDSVSRSWQFVVTELELYLAVSSHFRKSSSILQCPPRATRKFDINAHAKKRRFIMQNSNLVGCDFRLKTFMTKCRADRSGRTCYTVLDISNTGLTYCNSTWIYVLFCVPLYRSCDGLIYPPRSPITCR
jgi:hypothetical protein